MLPDTFLIQHSTRANEQISTVSLQGSENQKASTASTERNFAQQKEMLEILRTEIRSNYDVSSSLNSMVYSLRHRFSWFGKLLVSVKNMVSRGFTVNLATYRAVLSIQESINQCPSLDRPLLQEPFILEDGLGRIAPVHLQFITSWQAFEAVMRVRFEGLPGYEKITRHEFVLQEQPTMREISREQPWETAFRPGASVSMSITFRRPGSVDPRASKSSNSCPYCGTLSSNDVSSEVKWSVRL